MYAYILCIYMYYIHTFAFIFIYTSVFILVHLGTTRIVQLLVCISSRYAHSHACTWTQPRIYNHASTYTVRSGCSKATHIHTRTHKHINAHKHTHILIQTHTHTHTYRTGAYSLRHNDTHTHTHGVAAISSLLKIIGLFFKRALSKRLYSAKETYNFKEPSNCSHPIKANTNTNTHTHTYHTGACVLQHSNTHTDTYTHTHKRTHANIHTRTYRAGACGLQHQAFLALGAGKFASKHSQKSVLYVCSTVTLVASWFLRI